MKIAEFETCDGAAGGYREWLVVVYDADRGYVGFQHEYQSPGEEERKVWQDEGSGFDPKHLDGIIAALLQVQLLRSAVNRTG